MTPNLGEDNSTTSNGTAVNEFIYTPEIDPAPKKKIRTRSYKTELGEMTESRNVWRTQFWAMVVVSIVELVFIIALAAALKS
jgi:hypothetical protein